MKAVRYAIAKGNLWTAVGADNVGVADNRKDAVADVTDESLRLDRAANTVVEAYRIRMKSPMLVVGMNTWLRENAPFFLLQRFDVHVLFYPNSNAFWVCELVAFERQGDCEALSVRVGHKDIGKALTRALGKLCVLSQTKEPKPLEGVRAKLAVWLTHWVYRCPKISGKDILCLDPYQDGEIPEGTDTVSAPIGKMEGGLK